MAIMFDFHPDDGPTRAVTAHTDNQRVYDRLVDCAEGRIPGDEIVRLTDCTIETDQGLLRGEQMFRARLISHVRWG